jgi:hypothetical protein
MTTPPEQSSTAPTEKQPVRYFTFDGGDGEGLGDLNDPSTGGVFADIPLELNASQDICGRVLQLPGVTSCVTLLNDQDTASSDGRPAHSLEVVVEGGDDQAIADVIATWRLPMTQLLGNTSAVGHHGSRETSPVRFTRPDAASSADGAVR